MALKSTQQDNARWRFSRVGGLDQVRLDSADDLLHLGQLDQKYWTALACPVKGLEFSEKTLKLIDADNDGRVRAPEVIAAVDWVCGALHDPAIIIDGGDSLPLAAIKDEAILGSAKEILNSHGKSDAADIALADVLDTKAIFAPTKFNGDGIVTVASAGNDIAVQQVIGEIIAKQGPVADRSGAGGINAATIEGFFSELAAFESWSREAEDGKAAILPLDDGTAAAAAAVAAVQRKVDDYFARCRFAAFDSRAEAALNRQESDFLALAARDLSITDDEIAAFPLARIEAGRPLPLSDGINPAWATAVGALREAAVSPVLGAGKTSLNEKEWADLRSRLAPYQAWSNRKAGASVESLGLARIRELLGSNVREQLSGLIEQDLAAAGKFSPIAAVEKLILLKRDLYRLLLNFVSFADFYDPNRWAVFQSGTLYLDSRSCDLCVRVDAPNTLAAMSKAYIAYCTCTRPGEAPMTIAACFTQGDSDFLFVGRHGIFYDRKGRDWDAVITSIVENPLSVRQAFWLPYKKLLRRIEEQVAKRAAAAEAASDAKLDVATAKVATADKAAAAAPKKVDVGTVAAIGVVIMGAISALTLILGYVFGLAAWQYPLVLLGIILVISGPSMFIAALKLRQRTIGPILDGNGWAINGRVKVNIPFGTSLTQAAKVSPSQRTGGDPFEQKRTPWGLYLFLIVLITAAIWVRWDHNRNGHYFWQDPPAEAATPIESAAESAAEAAASAAAAAEAAAEAAEGSAGE